MGLKWLGHEADLSHLSSTILRIIGVIPLLPHGVDRDSILDICTASFVCTGATHWSFRQYKHYFVQQNGVYYLSVPHVSVVLKYHQQTITLLYTLYSTFIIVAVDFCVILFNVEIHRN